MEMVTKLTLWLVGEQGAIESHVAVIPEANCVWIGRWLLGHILFVIEDVALASSSNWQAHVSLVASAIWRKSYFCKKADALGNTLLSI
ncbi:hypothetical protein F444_10465 [Phytophthora nicotianae P1976]|uniref:Uncharacterized protein n=1 Tax=Phytophthora nicotianae P1976 TaxID=1317066 RepID=A0A081A3Y8_PHYNI|nr:hypothetical protein F444_10465 [Phytophthora nicotianae P1976]